MHVATCQLPDTILLLHVLNTYLGRQSGQESSNNIINEINILLPIHNCILLTFKDLTASVTVSSELNVNSLINCSPDAASSCLSLVAIYKHICMVCSYYYTHVSIAVLTNCLAS